MEVGQANLAFAIKFPVWWYLESFEGGVRLRKSAVGLVVGGGKEVIMHGTYSSSHILLRSCNSYSCPETSLCLP